VAIAAIAIAIVVTRPIGGSPEPSFYIIGSAQPGIQIGELAPGTPQAGDTASLPLVAPDGRPVSLADSAGEPIWIIFWKTACEPCEAEAPDVSAALAAHRADGLAVLGIDVWDSPADVRDYIASHPLPYPIAIATSSGFMDAYGLWGAPTHYFVDSHGLIRGRFFGPIARGEIEKRLAPILPPPP
jgi:cytochrome c biogenesis protein CcmG, thiol:disulfide interchange protein DsbE